MSRPESDRVRAHVRLGGRVQGVGFRYSMVEEARRHGLGGWVRNLDSGGVEAVIEGERASVEALLDWCASGPPGAWVRDVRVDWDESPKGLHQFEIRGTAFG
jgi:acylphosphatase